MTHSSMSRSPNDPSTTGDLECCGRTFDTAHGLAVHRGRAHGGSAPSPRRRAPSTAAPKRRPRPKPAPTPTPAAAAPPPPGSGALPDEVTDVIAAVACLEDRPAAQVVHELLAPWVESQLADPDVRAIADARAHHRQVSAA